MEDKKPITERDYGTYNPDIHKPFSSNLNVEQGSGTKGHPKRKTIVEMTALPDFIKRMKATKVGKHKNHLDIGIQLDSFAEVADEEEYSLNGVERHIGQMLLDDNQDAWDEFG